MSLKDLVLDAYASLSHKQAIGDGQGSENGLAPSWVPQAEKRRLDAYKVRAAYLSNVARHFLPQGVPDEIRRNRREYGDPDLLVDRIMAGVLGDNAEIVVEGADVDLPDAPELPPQPNKPDANDDNPLAQRIYDACVTLWTERATGIVDEWEADWQRQPALLERQEWLRNWSDDEMLMAKIVETERDIVGLADGVFVLALSKDKQRPVVDIYDPSFYFPVLTDTTRDYPTKVHLAWEFDQDGHTWVRRLTWELAPITVQLDATGAPLLDGETLVLHEGDRYATARDIATGVEPGSIVREYPWNVDDQSVQLPSAMTCFFTDATWRFDQLAARKADDFDLERATFATTEDGLVANRLDLHLDFLPVVHVPNTPAHREHYGRSAIDIVAQLLDDLSASDTDVQAASALAAGPVVHISGAALPQGRNLPDLSNEPINRHYIPPAPQTARQFQGEPRLEVRPGTLVRTGENGRMDVLDMSKGLTELRAVNDGLIHRLSVNARVPAELLGRVRASEVASGVALALAFGPFSQMVGVLRMAREPKYRLLLKFAQRLAQAGGYLPAGANPPARLAFGSYLPSDRMQLVSEVTQLLGAQAISHETAVALLVAGGFTIDDARGEIDRIRQDDTAGAVHVADATGSEQLAADRLGLDLPTTGVAPPRKPGEPPAPQPAGDGPPAPPPGA